MTRTAQSSRAENWADILAATLGCAGPPVDLYAFARHRHIKQLRMRLMVPRGALVPAEGGFDVYLRDATHRDIDISGSEPRGLLSARQRFSFAHEIAHTYFYKLPGSVPVSHGAVSNAMELEAICDRTAGHILVPTAALRQEIKYRVGDPEGIDAAFVRAAASTFWTSLPVMIERLRVAAPSNPFERCVVLARRVEGDAEIRACYFGMGLLPVLPRPRRYVRLSEWLPDLSPRHIADRDYSDWRVTRAGRTISFVKRELGDADFLLQAEVGTS